MESKERILTWSNIIESSETEFKTGKRQIFRKQTQNKIDKT